MEDTVKKNQPSVDSIKKSVKTLSVLSVLILIAFIATIAGIWYSNNLEQKRNADLANGIPDEDGAVAGASTENPESLVRLAENLKAAGFMLYGQSGDNKTLKQKDAFGQAYTILDYVECNPKAVNANPTECLARGIERYPSWVKGDKVFVGYKSPAELEEMLVENQ
jgi:hypothetical protein